VTATDKTAATTTWERRSVALVLGTAFMLLADVSIINIAAPSIQRDLGAGVAEIQLMIAAYQIAYATTLVTGGRLGDIFGRRALVLVGIASFTTASLACGLAQGSAQLVGFRVWQGISAGLLYPQVLATLSIVVPPERRSRVFAVFGAVVSSATIAGPLIAGVLIRLDVLGTGWRLIFLINVPVGVIILAFASALVPALRSPNANRLDLTGAVLAIVVLAAVTVPLTVGRDRGWPVWGWVCLGLAPPLAAAFLLWERVRATGHGSPLVPPGLWALPGFRLGLMLYLVLFSSVVPFFLYYSIVLQYGLGYGALTAGFAMVPYAVGTMATSLYSPRIVARFDTRNVLIAGSLICAAGSLLMAVTLLVVPETRLLGWWFAPAMVVTGLGLGLIVPPLLTFVLGTVPTTDMGAVSGLLSTAQQLGAALGVAVIGVVFLRDLPDGLVGATYSALRGGLGGAVLLIAGCFLAAALLVTRLARHRPAAPPGRH
jgi:EmrB/QacA subfamily drug resistance transporter